MMLAAIILVAVHTQQPSRYLVTPPDTQNIEGDPGNTPASEFQFWEDPFPQWVVALFSVLATGVSFLAVRYVRDTWRETKRTADAAVAANVASEAATRATTESAEREKRAYIAVLPADVRAMDLPTGPYKWIGHVQIKNVGAVPASNVRTLVKAQVSPIKDRRQFDQPDATENIGVIAPSVAIEQGSEPIDVPEPSSHRQKFVYVFGTVNYVDGFGHERWTRFCHRYTCAMTDVHDSKLPTFRGINAKYGRQHQAGNDAT